MKRSLLVMILVLFAACSGDNGTEPKDDNNHGGGGGVVTHIDSLRVNVAQAFAEQLDLWDGMSADSIAARAAGYLGHQPLIKSSGITPGTTTVWAVFTDGVPLIFPNNRNPSAGTDTLIDDAAAPAPSRAAPQRRVVIPAGRKMFSALRVPTRALELPAQPTFRAVNAIGTCYTDPLPVLKSLLRKGHYVDAGPLNGTVESFASIHGNGIVYIDSHGGIGMNDENAPVYGIWTATPHDFSTLDKYNDMIHDGQLVIMTERGRDELGQCRHVCHYGITGAFVSVHMNFAKNSLVFIDACSSASVAALDMQQAFKNNNASHYLGWSNEVDDAFAYKAMKYLFDRLLGVNVISPEDPKQRAFNIDQVLGDMATHRHLIDDPYKHAQLTSVRLNDDFGLLSPTIQFLSMDDDGQQPRLLIAGIFGKDPGEGKRSVTINGQELDNISWYPTEIDCDIPETGSNASGTVVVKVGTGNDARESNHVNITEWIGELTYDRDDPGSLAAQMKIKVRILADIHDFRDEPGETPFKTTVLFIPRGDTNIHMTTGGTYEENLGSCKDTWTFGQGGEVGTPFGTGQGTDGTWTYFGSIDTESHTLQLSIAVLGVFKAGTYVRTRTGPDPCDTFNLPQWVSLYIDDCLYDDLVGTKGFRMQMDNDFVVAQDERVPCDADDPLIGEVNDNHAQGKIKWGEMTPFFLPDPDAAR